MSTWERYEEEAAIRWVCDGCVRFVSRDEIAEWADGEHVLCVLCVTGSAS